MCVATAVVVGASVAGSYASAKIASNASKSAANTQAQSGREALGVQQNMFQQQQEALAPFREAGTTALGRLNQFQTFNGVPAGPRGLGAGIQRQQGDPFTNQPAYGTPGQKGVMGAPDFNRYGAASGPPPPAGGPPAPMGPPGPSSGALAPGAPGPLVMMRAPDGSTQQVPAEQVPHFQSRGAQVIG